MLKEWEPAKSFKLTSLTLKIKNYTLLGILLSPPALLKFHVTFWLNQYLILSVKEHHLPTRRHTIEGRA